MRRLSLSWYMVLVAAIGIIALLVMTIQDANAQTAYQTGITAVSLSNSTATGAGITYTIPSRSGLSGPSTIAWTVTFKTAAPGAQTMNLEGSIDNLNWYTIDTSTVTTYTSDTNSGEMRFVSSKPVPFLRCNLATYTKGSNAGVTCQFFAR
jgi:hypothetical protein